MDPDNLLRGPRRALRRGDPHALRYDRRLGQPDLGGAVDEWEDEAAGGVSASDDNNEADGQLGDEMSEEGVSGVEYDNGDDEDGGSLDPEAYGELAGDEMMDSGEMGEGEGEDEGEGEEGEEYEYDGTQQEEEMQDDKPQAVFDPLALGLKEINNLAHFSVSSHKPGSGVAELLSDDLSKYWQSDGPQPHLLTIHFLRRVEIRAIRFYVDYSQDESYTPTSVLLSAGTGHHDLQPFLMVVMTNPSGWQDVDLGNVGGGADGRSLCCWIVQLQVKENHQNGKDTHIRGIKLYGIDENAPSPPPPPLAADVAATDPAALQRRARATLMQGHFDRPQLQRNLLYSPLSHGSFSSLAFDPRSNGPAPDADEYLLEQLLARLPGQVDSVLEGAGSTDNFLRDMEIR